MEEDSAGKARTIAEELMALSVPGARGRGGTPGLVVRERPFTFPKRSAAAAAADAAAPPLAAAAAAAGGGSVYASILRNVEVLPTVFFASIQHLYV